MGTKTAVDVRPAIPLQKDGRAELQELAAVLSHHVERRHRDRGAHAVEVVTEPELYDLAAEPEPLPVRVPEPVSKTVNRAVRRAVPLVIAGVLTTIVTTAAWTGTHAAPAVAHQPVQQSATQSFAAPTTPAQWGDVAHQRLSRAGRPVDIFGCQSAYAADATSAAGALPPASTNPEPWHAYLAACLSGMSDASTGQSG